MDKTKIRRARVQQKREVRIHSELWHTANCLLEAGQKDIKASAHQFRASLVFRAFFLEAFLNWLGHYLVPHWSYLERLKPREKLELVNDVIHVTPDYGSRPWQIVNGLFTFRNDLAHGKREILQVESEEDFNEFLNGNVDHAAQTEWERFSTQENAVRAKEDVEKIATLLYEKAQVKHEGLRGPFSFGYKIRSATLGLKTQGT
jgi:hypothetical protein